MNEKDFFLARINQVHCQAGAPKRLYIWGAVLVRGYFRGCGAGLKERAWGGGYFFACRRAPRPRKDCSLLTGGKQEEK